MTKLDGWVMYVDIWHSGFGHFQHRYDKLCTLSFLFTITSTIIEPFLDWQTPKLWLVLRCNHFVFQCFESSSARTQTRCFSASWSWPSSTTWSAIIIWTMTATWSPSTRSAVTMFRNLSSQPTIINKICNVDIKNLDIPRLCWIQDTSGHIFIGVNGIGYLEFPLPGWMYEAY